MLKDFQTTPNQPRNYFQTRFLNRKSSKITIQRANIWTTTLIYELIRKPFAEKVRTNEGLSKLASMLKSAIPNNFQKVYKMAFFTPRIVKWTSQRADN